ncbi:unnamed protein product [Rotaria magnacalcarata]|uniref:Uncharacterized protein n=1 Tax=Rotaria magnacalcarata TaxID=392030 RepID=A0A818YTW2_9BILA|nr:unnamed protein product [Rotaria magnacalcarata]CAF2173875.1 unnamed protein product [Rotaria magnacalcarata]CAF3759358.1 unnamed protein product [Rotaria magnacalcarata]CAF3805631.1 unnamed protein product [Rotaria magnacalcarata]
MSDEYISYVPNNNGRFVRYSYTRPSPSSNGLVELGRMLLNLTRVIFQLLNVLHSVMATFNNIMSSLPFFLRYIVHGLLAICFPFYSVYQGYVVLINRIHQITYPIYRAVTLISRIFTFVVQLPLRMITFCITETQALLRNLLILLIFVGIIFALALILLNNNQLDYIKSYVQNTTDFILKKSSMI